MPLRLSSLSARHQYRVLSLVAEGLLNKQIADRLGVQLRTVKAHMTRIMERLGVRNRAQAIRVLHEDGADRSLAAEIEEDAGRLTLGQARCHVAAVAKQMVDRPAQVPAV